MDDYRPSETFKTPGIDHHHRVDHRLLPPLANDSVNGPLRISNCAAQSQQLFLAPIPGKGILWEPRQRLRRLKTVSMTIRAEYVKELRSQLKVNSSFMRKAQS